MTAGQPAVGGPVGGPRSGARGEYGDLIPLRPGTGIPAKCLRGEFLVYYGMTRPFSHRYRLHCTLCETCRRVEACDPSEGRLSEWAQLDVTVRHLPAAAPEQGLVLVAHPAAAGAEPERTELQLDGAAATTATVSCCAACRTASLDYVHVVAAYRRLGYGRTLVAAAHAGAPQYRWTAPLPDGVVAQAFRARIQYPKTGAPCVHREHRGGH